MNKMKLYRKVTAISLFSLKTYMMNRLYNEVVQIKETFKKICNDISEIKNQIKNMQDKQDKQLEELNNLGTETKSICVKIKTSQTNLCGDLAQKLDSISKRVDEMQKKLSEEASVKNTKDCTCFLKCLIGIPSGIIILLLLIVGIIAFCCKTEPLDPNKAIVLVMIIVAMTIISTFLINSLTKYANRH